MTATNTLDVPQRFWDDHVSRDLVNDEATYVAKRLSRTYRVRITDRDLHELRSDAAHYADLTNGWDPDLAGLCSSAAATVRAIDRYAAAVA